MRLTAYDNHQGSTGCGRTYGLRRFSILAALGNAILLLVAIGAIAWEAVGRFQSPLAVCLTAHLIRPEVCDDDELLLKVYRELEKTYGIRHPTVQIERGHGPTPCGLGGAEVV